MPRNSLRFLDALDDDAESTTRAPGSGDAEVPDGPGGDRPREIADIPGLPEELQTLLGERGALEERMASLTGGTGGATAAVADPRYRVTPLGERRRQDAAWAQRRELSAIDRAGEAGSEGSAIGRAVRGHADAFREPPKRTGQRALRGVGRDRAEPLRPLRRVGRDLTEPLQPLRGVGRHLAEPLQPLRPLADTALPELRGDPGLREFGRSVPEPAVRELRSLDDTLQAARRRLDILEGGSGNLDHLREQAMRRLGERREESARDRHRDQMRTERTRRSDEERDTARLDRRYGGIGDA